MSHGGRKMDRLEVDLTQVYSQQNQVVMREERAVIVISAQGACSFIFPKPVPECHVLGWACESRGDKICIGQAWVLCVLHVS